MEHQGQLQPHYPDSEGEEEEEEEEWPWTILNHIPRFPNEDPILHDERIYLFQGNPTTQPKILRLFADGSFFVQDRVCPSNTDLLEMIGHSRGQICFRNASRRQIVVWNLQGQRIRTVVEDVDEPGNDDYLMLQREGPSFHWHKLLAFRSTVFNVADDFFIPLVCYYGVGDDGVIHILLHRNKEEIVCVIPATKQVLPVAGAAFPPAGILAVPSGIPMEVADSRKFKATQTSRF